MYTKFTSDMKKDHLVLVPSMLPIHFKFLVPIFEMNGYKLEVLETDNDNIRLEGLAHVHNDMCYPALLVIGQLHRPVEVVVPATIFLYCVRLWNAKD